MFEWWGRFVYRRRWLVMVVSLALFVATLPFARGVLSHLSTGGWIGPDTEADRVDRALHDEFDRRSVNDYFLFRDPTGKLKATDPAFVTAVEAALSPIRDDPAVSAIYTYGATRNPTLLAADGRSSLAIVALKTDADSATRAYPAFRARVTSDRLEVLAGGWPAVSKAFTDVTKGDLRTAEMVSLPITLLLLVLVFGSLVAAGLPLTVGVLSIVTTLAGIALLARLTLTSVFVVNVASMMGLAVAVDYSLFLVSRYREEIARRPPEAALATTMTTAGRAVLFSGLTVAIGIAGLVFFPTPALRTFGAGGALVVLVGVGYSLTLLAALLAILGPRVDRFRLPLLARFAARSGDQFWRRLAEGVMRHPLPFLIPTLLILLAVGLPFRHFRGASPGMTMLPRDQEARGLYDAVQTGYPDIALSPVYVLVRPRTGKMTDPANLAALERIETMLAKERGVRRVDGFWSAADAYVRDHAPPGVEPDEAVAFIHDHLDEASAMLTADAALAGKARRYLTPSAAVLDISMPGDDSDATHQALVHHLRARGALLSGGALTLQVGGGAAVTDELVREIETRAPLAVGFVVVVTYVVLFLLLGSVLLPLKAILMNLLSITASYGALVWVFQEGHLAGPLGFEPLGYTSAVVPVMMFCFLFGLSMDYEVLMLSRIKEEHERTGDNAEAVARGLAATGRLVTSAALIMVVVFGSFGLSRLLLVKSLGIGQALAVGVDATLIRALLVPATMRLLGRWNWWAPASLRRWTGRAPRSQCLGPVPGAPQAPFAVPVSTEHSP